MNNRTRILAFKNKPHVPVECIPKYILSPPPKTKSSKPKRYIHKIGEVVMSSVSLYVKNPSDSFSEELVTLDGEKGPITSVSWGGDGILLAVGLNNSLVQLWDNTKTKLLRTLSGGHQERVGSLAWNGFILTTGVEALAWCPFQGNLLASGGAGSDQCIKMWNTRTGACLSSVNTGSPVCALLWNENERELLSSHESTKNQLTLWKYPSMVKMVDLTGHTKRVLYMAQSPNGCTVASAADARLRFWNVFGTPEVAWKAAAKTNREPFANFNRIR